MLPTLSAVEARIIGCLIEKSIVTPDQYPLTLNALTTACNQKSARVPVMSLSKGEVQRMTRQLDAKNLLRTNENFKSSVEKYSQLLCNTRYNDFRFEPPQLALLCVLLLRGAQTPGELRTNCRRLYDFADTKAVSDSLGELMQHPRGPLVVKLPRAPGRRDSEYMHLFCGEIDLAAHEAAAGNKQPAPRHDSAAGLEARVAVLEQQLAELRQMLGKTD